VDFSHSVAALIPGVQGKLLESIAGLGRSVTSRQAASIAQVSENQASKILRELAALGILVRTDAGNAALYELSGTNLAANLIRQICNLRQQLFESMRTQCAEMIKLKPGVWIAVFGSTARGDSTSSSDIDVLIVRPDPIGPDYRDVWDRMIFDFSETVSSLAGNAVNPVEYWRSEVDPGRPFWREVLRDQVTIAGVAPLFWTEKDSLLWPEIPFQPSVALSANPAGAQGVELVQS
jgi:predicted nucleotidyltransferase